MTKKIKIYKNKLSINYETTKNKVIVDDIEYKTIKPVLICNSTSNCNVCDYKKCLTI